MTRALVITLVLAASSDALADAVDRQIGARRGHRPCAEKRALLEAQVLWPQQRLEQRADAQLQVRDRRLCQGGRRLAVKQARQAGVGLGHLRELGQIGKCAERVESTLRQPRVRHRLSQAKCVACGRPEAERESLAPDLIGLIQRQYTPGTNAPFLDVDGVGVGLAICFDVIYDEVIWAGAQDGAELYMFQTNNADFRDTDENLQQLAFARMRAVETGRSVVNLSTVGTSQVIAPDGSTIDGLPAGEAGHMLTDVPLRTGLTPAVVLGPWVQALLGWGSLLALIALGIGVAVRARRDARTPVPEGTGVAE